MKKATHRWGPWTQKYNLFGEALGYGERRCLDGPGCGYESEPIPWLHEWLVMDRRALRARR